MDPYPHPILHHPSLEHLLKKEAADLVISRQNNHIFEEAKIKLSTLTTLIFSNFSI